MSDHHFAALQRIAGPVSRETFDHLTAFQALFEKWAARINLAAPSTLGDLWNRHILDSAQVFPLAPTNAFRWVDLGSGGGFPGVVLAIMLRERPGASIALVESSHKKAAFLRNAIAQAGAPGTVHAVRIEDIAADGATADVVTARALAPLQKLLGLASPWLMSGARGLFHKGRDYQREIEESRDAWQFDLVEHRSEIDAASVILEISDLKKR